MKFSWSNSNEGHPPRLVLTADDAQFDPVIIRNWQAEGFKVSYLPYTGTRRDYERQLAHLPEPLELGEKYAVVGKKTLFFLEKRLLGFSSFLQKNKKPILRNKKKERRQIVEMVLENKLRFLVISNIFSCYLAYGDAAMIVLDVAQKPMPKLCALVAYYPTKLPLPAAGYPSR